MTKQLTNEQAAQMLTDLDGSGILDIVGLVGYVAALDYKALREATETFFEQRSKLIAEYGEEVTDQDGNIVDYEVKPTSARFSDFIAEYKKIADMTVEVSLRTVDETEAMKVISGKQLLAASWLFESEVSDEHADD